MFIVNTNLVMNLLQDYETRIQSLQEQVERHSMMSSMAPEDFEDEDMFGEYMNNLQYDYYTFR